MTSTQELIDHLQLELGCIEELNALLLEERELLATRQYEQLEPLADKKEALSDKLEQSALSRTKITQGSTNKDPKTALQDFLKTCSSGDAIRIDQLNKALVEKLVTCQEYNTINGQVIATNIHLRKDIVETLSTPQNNTDAVNVYTANGDVKSSQRKGRHQKA